MMDWTCSKPAGVLKTPDVVVPGQSAVALLQQRFDHDLEWNAIVMQFARAASVATIPQVIEITDDGMPIRIASRMDDAVPPATVVGFDHVWTR